MSTRTLFVLACFAALALWPLGAGSYGIDLVTKIMIYAILALSLELLVGTTGLVCFGQAAFFGIGAYAAVLLSPQSEPAGLWWLLPACVLGLHSMAYLSRMTRSFMLAQLSQEYITTARVKGLSRRQVVWGHAFLNIRVQLLTILALAYGGLLEGAVLVETVFGWPGFGSYLTGSLLLGDMNAVMGSVLVIGLLFVALNLTADALYRVFDPRARA